MKWITRERPVIDRIACPWLIARFIDKEPEFLFVPPSEVQRVAKETGATPYDIPDVELTHVGDGCSFDSFMAKYGLEREPALAILEQDAAYLHGLGDAGFDARLPPGRRTHAQQRRHADNARRVAAS